MLPIGQIISMVLGSVLQNAGDDHNQNGIINAFVNKLSKSSTKKMKSNFSDVVDKVNKQNKLF